MSVKNNWIKKFFVFLLVFMTLASSFPLPVANAAAGDIILLWDGTEASIPAGWTCVSCAPGDPFYNVFPRAAASYGGTGGGPETGITHTVSYDTSTGNSGSAVNIITLNVVDPATVAAQGHTHSAPANLTSGTSSISPEHRNLLFIMKTDPISLPVGIIGMFDKTTLPANWTAYDEMNGGGASPNNVQRYLRGAIVDEILTTKSATLPTDRALFSCSENSSTNKIYCFGGWDGSYLNEIVEYDPGTDTLTTKSATLPTGRYALSCFENSSTNKIYCFGGQSSSGYLNEIIEYDPATNIVTTKSATLPTARNSFSCSENSSTGKIYCFGGDDSVAGYLNQIVEYDPATNIVTTKSATLPTDRYLLSCSENSSTNKIYCFGGWDGSYLNEIVEYDPGINTVTTKSATLPTARRSLSCSENSSTNKIYCFGGWSGSSLNQIVEYDPTTNTVTTKSATLPTGREAPSCSENSSTNKIYCFGGWDGSYLNEIVEYDPGIIGGSATHNHARPISGVSGAASATSPANTTTPLSVTTLSSHTHTVAAGTLPDANNLPSYATVVFAKLTVDNDSPPDGLIAMFNTTSMLIGWTVISGAGSSYENRLIRGTSSCASPCPQTGGVTTHAHTSQVVTSSASSSLAVTLLDTAVAPGEHTHNFTVGYSPGNSMPIYRDVILAKLKAIDVSGTVYSGEGTGPLSGKNLKVGILGIAARVAMTDGSGNYLVKIPDPGVGNNITVWLNGESQKGAVATRSGGGDISGLDIYQDRLIVRHEDAGPITNANIGICDKTTGAPVCATTDLFFDAVGSVLTADSGVQIFVWTGKTYTPGGNVSSPEIKVAGTLSAGANTLTLTGNGTPFVIGGTFTPSTSTVTYAPTGTTGVTVASTTYNNVIFNKLGNAFSLTTGGITTQVGGDLAITAGTLDTTTSNYPIFVGGSWSNSGTFTANAGTVTLTSTSTDKTLSGTLNGSSGFYNLIFNGTGGGWTNSSAMLVNNDLTMTAGTLSGTSNVNVNGNAIGTAGVINLTGGTFTQTATGGDKSFGATAGGINWTFSSLTFDNDGSARVIDTQNGTGTMTVSSVLTITASTSLDAKDRIWILSGSDTPAVVSGTITPSTSTFRFTGSSATNIRAADYYNLQIFPGDVSATHTLGTASGQTFTVVNNLDLGGNSNASGTVITAATHNPAISVAGNLTLCASTCSNQMTFTKGTGTITLKPTGTKTWIDNNPTTKQDVGVVSISGGASLPQINLGSSVMAESVNIAAAHTFNANGSNTLTLKGNNIPFVISGTFTPSTGTVTYAPTVASTVTVASTTYNHVIFNKLGNMFSLTTGGITTQNGGNLTISNGTLNTVAGQNYPISVGGNWTNNGTFTANAGTVTFTSISGGRTLAGTMTGTSAFNNLTFNGISGGWTLSNNLTASSILNITNGTVNAASGTISLTGNGTPFVIGGGGVFTPTTSTVAYAPSDTTGVNVANTTYHHVTFNKADNIFRLVSGGIITQNTGGNLTITAGTLDTVSGQNYPISVGGSWSNSGIFLANLGTVTFTSLDTGRTIAPGSSAFNDLKFNGAGGWSFSAAPTLNGNMIVQAGALSGTNGATINGGNLTCLTTCGAISFTGGTVTLKGTGNLGTFNLNPTWTFFNFSLGDGSTTATTTAVGGATTNFTITSVLTVNTNHTLDGGPDAVIITLSGTGTPLVATPATFVPSTSTLKYVGNGATNITATTYNNLELKPTASTPTYTIQSGTLTANGNLTIGNGTNALTTTANANDPIIAVTGNLTNSASASFTASSSASFSVGGNWSNSGTFTANSGTVIFNGTGTKTITRGASDFYNIVFSSAGTWSFTGVGATSLSLRSFDIANMGATVTGVSGTTTMVGDWGNIGTYNHNDGTVLFVDDAVTSNVTGATTFRNLTVTEETKTLRFEPSKRTKIAGLITIGGSSPTYVCAFPVKLFSTVDGSKWEIEILAGASIPSIQYAYVKDSNAITTAITANNTFKVNTGGLSGGSWGGTSCLPKLTTILPSSLAGIVGSAVSFNGSDADADSTAIVQWDGFDMDTIINTDGRGLFEQDVAGFNRLNFFIPEDEAGTHTIGVRAVRSVGTNMPETTDNISEFSFTINPWFWMSDFSAREGDTITLWGNGYVCGGLATLVRAGSDTSSTTNISLQPPPPDPCTGGGGGGGEGATVDLWEEVADFE